MLNLLSKRLKKLRENCGYTQQQIAEALSIDRSTYAYYEIGKTTPDINTIIKLAKIFHISYNELLDDEDFPSPVHDFDNLEDLEDFNLSIRYGRKNFGYVYELTKQEKQLIIYYRLFSPEAQEHILNLLYTQLDEKSKRKNPPNDE